MRILDPVVIADTPLMGATGGAGSGAANLLTPSPREVWIADAVGGTTIDFDLGAAQDIQGFFVGATNASAGSTWKIQTGTGLGVGLEDIYGYVAFRAADSIGPVHHGWAVLPAPVNARYFRVSIIQTGDDPLLIGLLLVGAVFQAPYEYGGGRVPIDTSTIEAMPDGGFGIGEGVVKAGFRWTFIDLAPAVRRELWRLVYGRGQGKPVVIDEEAGEGAGLNEELHYGLFDRFEPYVREAPGSTRWALSMVDWG